MNNGNRLSLKLVPVGGLDKQVDCASCPSACCRVGMSIPLSSKEAKVLVDAGTQMRQLEKSEAQGNSPGIGRKFYRLLSDCGNLSIDPETGESSCRIWQTEDYPKICSQLKPGSYRCVDTQLTRIEIGEDTNEL